jgi:8-oxo-dGTP pyrophosphatase MutT (NUDIX family)
LNAFFLFSINFCKVHPMKQAGSQRFWQSLEASQRSFLRALRDTALQPRPPHWIEWRCGAASLGWLEPQRADWLAKRLPAANLATQGLVWQAHGWTEPQRSASLQAVLQRARAEGLLQGWRDEHFSFWDTDCAQPDPQRTALFEAERAGFRFLGLLSHAVHVNGFMPDGRLWCGRRALHKATDPGQLDNITAGGLPSGETVMNCLQRELAEEAGLFRLSDHGCQAVGPVRTSRQEPEGWHDEFLHVFNLSLAEDFAPINQDAEVSEFVCLDPSQVLAQIETGAFTHDAVHTLLQGLFSGMNS